MAGIWGLLQFPSAWVGARAQDQQCKAKPKTSSLGHTLILCQGSVEGLLMQREVGVAWRRHLTSSCHWRGFDGEQKLSSAVTGWLCAVLVVRPVWPELALPQGRDAGA